MTFDLPPLDGTATPAFLTTEDCKRWLGEQTLANAATVQRQLRDQLDLLNRRQLPMLERFGILEILRSRIAFVQEEACKRYASKPMPLLAPEAEAYVAALALWQAVTIGYLRCVEDANASGESLQTLALVIERSLAALHSAQHDRVRGFVQPDSVHWSRLHALLALAEQRNVINVEVADKARHGDQMATPLSVYGESILLHAASAHEFSARPLNWVVRWARRWSSKLVMLSDPPLDLQAVPINVDLASNLPPSPFPIKNAIQGRFLGTMDISTSIKARLVALAEGRSPAELQLGDDCTQPACEQMLQRLLQRWCKGAMQRPTDRQAVTGAVGVIAGFEAIWFHFAGKPFKQPRSTDDSMLRREREELAAFGRISERHDAAAAERQEFRIDAAWQIVDESPGGMRIVRALTAAGGIRIGVGQLIAVKKAGATTFSLASVRWLMVEDGGLLHVGVGFLPAAATPVSLHPAGINAIKEPWRPAFHLVDAGGAGQLVVPAGRSAPTGSLMSRASQLNSTKWRRRSNAARILNVFNWLDMAQSASFGLIADPCRVLKICGGGVSAASRGACFVACPADMFRLSRAARMAFGQSTCQLAHRPGGGNTKQCFAKPALRPCYVFQHPVKLAEAI